MAIDVIIRRFRRRSDESLPLVLTRVWLPLAIAIAGAVAIVVGHGSTALAAAGVVLLGTALMVWMINWMFRLSIDSNKEREQEERAREYFDEHGRWPDE
jgi:ACR3 family arsenite efflux pump ArsB